MKKIAAMLMIIFACSSLTACQNKMAGTALGGVAGAGLGAAVTGGSAWGTGIGAVGGALIGNAASGR